MKKIIVPADVKKKVKKDITSKILTLALNLLFAAAIVVVFSIFLPREDHEHLYISVSAAIIIGLVGAYLKSGIHGYITDRSWYGRIIEVDVKDVKISKTFRERKREAGDSIQYVMVETPNKKLHTCEIYDDGRIYSSRARNYNLGDTVVHVYGCEYLRPVNHPDQGKPQVCVVCGFKSDSHAEKCEECGHTLDIRLEDR